MYIISRYLPSPGSGSLDRGLHLLRVLRPARVHRCQCGHQIRCQGTTLSLINRSIWFFKSAKCFYCLVFIPSTHQCWSFKCFYCWPLPCQPAVRRHCSELHQQMSSSRLVSKYFSPSMSRKSQQNIYDEILKYFLNTLSRDLKLSRIKKCRTQTVTACTVMSECCQGGDTFAHYMN